MIFEFSLNGFSEFAEISDNSFVQDVILTCLTSCVRTKMLQQNQHVKGNGKDL